MSSSNLRYIVAVKKLKYLCYIKTILLFKFLLDKICFFGAYFLVKMKMEWGKGKIEIEILTMLTLHPPLYQKDPLQIYQ